MVIIAGKIYVAAEQRDAYIAQHAVFIRSTREEPGCLDVVIADDPIEADRVNNFEVWESQAKLDAFRRKANPPQTNIEILDDQVQKGSSAHLVHWRGPCWPLPLPAIQYSLSQ